MTVGSHVTDPALAAVLETSAAAREQAIALAELLEQHADSAGIVAGHEALHRQLKLLNASVAHLRGLHRRAHLRARETKAHTAEARHEVDVLHLQLQNLYYEKRHLEGEIRACESFDHTYQKLPLIPTDEFLSRFPEHADDGETALMVARINHEREEREKLEQQRLELLKRKQKLIAENKKRRDDLANLDKDLEKFIDAAKPIQKMFEKEA